MNRIHYAGHSIVTGSAIADGLLEYAQALASVVSSATVRVPTLAADLRVGVSQFLIGPASQLLSVAESTDADEIVDEDLVRQMHERAIAVQRGTPTSSMAPADFKWSGDWHHDY